MARKKTVKKARTTKKRTFSLHPLHIIIASFSITAILLVIVFGVAYNVSLNNSVQAYSMHAVQH